MASYIPKKDYVAAGRCMWRAVQAAIKNGKEQATAELVGRVALGLLWHEVISQQVKDMFDNDKDAYFYACGLVTGETVNEVINQPRITNVVSIAKEPQEMINIYRVGVYSANGGFRQTGSLRIEAKDTEWLATYNPKAYGVEKKRFTGDTESLKKWVCADVLWGYGTAFVAPLQLMRNRLKLQTGTDVLGIVKAGAVTQPQGEQA